MSGAWLATRHSHEGQTIVAVREQVGQPAGFSAELIRIYPDRVISFGLDG